MLDLSRGNYGAVSSHTGGNEWGPWILGLSLHSTPGTEQYEGGHSEQLAGRRLEMSLDFARRSCQSETGQYDVRDG